MVYVDDMYKYPTGQFGRMKMSHLIVDSKGLRVGVRCDLKRKAGAGLKNSNRSGQKRVIDDKREFKT